MTEDFMYRYVQDKKQEEEEILRLKRLQAEIGMADDVFDELCEKHGLNMIEQILLMCRNPVIIPIEKAQEVLDAQTPMKFLSFAPSRELTEFQKALHRDIIQSLKIPMSGWKSDEET